MKDFGQLLETEIPRLRRYARSLCRWNVSAADDLVQDTLVRAVAKEHLWKPGTNLRAWLFTLMHNQYVNQVRRAVREGMTVDFDEFHSNAASTSDPTISLLVRDLTRGLAKLPEEQRQTIVLIGIEGMSYEEAAQCLRIPTGTVRSRLSRGRDHLRHIVDVHVDDAAVQSAPAPRLAA